MKHAQAMLDQLWAMGFRPTVVREATEDDVTAALVDAYIELPVTTPVEARELYNIVLDQMSGERARVMAEDEAKILAARRAAAHRLALAVKRKNQGRAPLAQAERKPGLCS